MAKSKKLDWINWKDVTIMQYVADSSMALEISGKTGAGERAIEKRLLILQLPY